MTVIKDFPIMFGGGATGGKIKALQHVDTTFFDKDLEETYVKPTEKQTGEESPFDINPLLPFNWSLSVLPRNGERVMLNTAKSITLPQREQEVSNRSFAGRPYSIVSRDTTPTQFSVTFWDSDTLAVYRYMVEWFEHAIHQRQSPSGYSMDPRAVSRILFFELISSEVDKKGNPKAMKIPFTFCMPTSISELNFSHEEGGLVTFDVQFSYVMNRDAEGHTAWERFVDILATGGVGILYNLWDVTVGRNYRNDDEHISYGLVRHPISTVKRFFNSEMSSYDDLSKF